MERTTREITTSSGHKVKFLSYITTAERRDMYEPLYSKMEVQGDGQKVSAVSGSMANTIQDREISKIIKEIDDSSENILEKVLDLPASPDFDEILAVLNEITGKKKLLAAQKQNSSTSEGN